MHHLPFPIIYITRDIERVLGIPLETPEYSIIANITDFAKSVQENHDSVLLIQGDHLLDTHELLLRPETSAWIEDIKKKSGKQPHLLVFKPTEQIEKICVDHTWPLLNPSAALANRIEEKISQVAWLGEFAQYLPKHKIKKVKEITWRDEPCIVQFNRSHTGSGTRLIESETELRYLRSLFPDRPARVMEYIQGPVFTVNAIVHSTGVFVGNISYQITGISPFTDQSFATVGNDWGLADRLLSPVLQKEIAAFATRIGERMRRDGWKGLFGLDCIVERDTHRLYLIEINARQPASSTYESFLQDKARSVLQEGGKERLTVFEAHLEAIIGRDCSSQTIVSMRTGAQVIVRAGEKMPQIDILRLKRYADRIILYPNTKPGADLVRIQTDRSLLEQEGVLNQLGRSIAACIHGPATDSFVRAGVLCIVNDCILLIERSKYGKDYFVIPGGHVEKDETAMTAALRELKEETTLDATFAPRDPILVVSQNRKEYYFVAESVYGTATMSGEERDRSNQNNRYRLSWVSLFELEKIPLLPNELRERIIAEWVLKKKIATLSLSALERIADYLALPFTKTRIGTPYFNNRIRHLRAALRVLIGKGTPQEIVEEAEMMAIREKQQHVLSDPLLLRPFLIDHGLGIDCSGFVYHVLSAELLAKRHMRLAAKLTFHSRGLLRRLFAPLRPAENTSVQTLADDLNSSSVSFLDMQPADMICLFGDEKNGEPDHVLLVYRVDRDSKGMPTSFLYAHSFAWKTDGPDQHGVRLGRIDVDHTDLSLLGAHWTESGVLGEENETWKKVKNALRYEIRRLKCLTLRP